MSLGDGRAYRRGTKTEAQINEAARSYFFGILDYLQSFDGTTTSIEGAVDGFITANLVPLQIAKVMRELASASDVTERVRAKRVNRQSQKKPVVFEPEPTIQPELPPLFEIEPEPILRPEQQLLHESQPLPAAQTTPDEQKKPNKAHVIPINSAKPFLRDEVWKKHNGEIPKGYRIIHIDGNAANHDIENLKSVSIAELCGQHKPRKSSKRVRGIVDGEEFTFSSIREAARATGFGRSSIWGCVKGVAETCRGWTFEFVDEASF